MDNQKNLRQKRKAVVDNKKKSAKKPTPPKRSSTNETKTPLANVTNTSNIDVNLINPTHIHTHPSTSTIASQNSNFNVPSQTPPSQIVFPLASSNFIRNWNATLRQIASNEPNPAFGNMRPNHIEEFNQQVHTVQKEATNNSTKPAEGSTSSRIQVEKNTNLLTSFCNVSQPSQLNNVVEPPPTKPHYQTRGVNLYNKFTATLSENQTTLGNNEVGTKKKSQYSTIFENHVIESSSDESDTSDNCSSDGQSASDDEQDIEDDDQQGYFDIGDPIWECQQCGAFMWYQERKNKRKDSITPQFQLCCHGGKAQLPLLDQPPELLQHLLFNYHSADSKNYQAHTRIYNSMFAFTSPGMKLDERKRIGKGPPTLRIQGQVCHRIGSMLPVEGQPPKFAQLYIYDTENEIKNRMQNFSNIKDLDANIVHKLKVMLDEHNVHARSFRMAKQTLQNNFFQDLKFKLISERTTDGRIYNKPTVSEVAALIVGDIDSAAERDIIMHKRSGQLKRINEFHPAYLAYQYPLIFPYGEDGFRTGIQFRYRHETEITKRNRLTIKDWLCFRIQKRKKEAQTLLCSRRLFQQFLVDGYTMMETERLNWLRKNQNKLRVGKYHKLKEGTQNPNNDPNQKRGTRVILPSTFVGSKRYMDQLYFDGMAISSAVGFPDIFITFTCNPTWPEITRELAKNNLKPQDRPDIVSKVFKIKFDELMKDLTKRHILGKVLAYMYTIEFQKRGLPHAHILIFLHPSSKYPSPEDIDTIISAEIPNPDSDPELYNLVKKHMIHGPCGSSRLQSPCTVNGRCTKFFPKKFNEKTIVDQDGYPVYRRSSNSYTVEKNGVTLDNGYVVPYNKRLLLKYQGHINMEWCNQSSSIKYLFKYIHKGYDRITATVERAQNNGGNQQIQIDEIKQYVDCRYISPCEACWRIFSFKIHGRKPAVERMFFHLVGENTIYFTDFDRMENILEKPSVTESMFTSWLQANKDYPAARKLTYGQFVTKFTYSKKKKSWTPRKRGFKIGRLIWVPPTTGELFYLRMMLTVVKGPMSYEDIKKVRNIQYDTFRDACFAKGFLGDDKEYISAIREAHGWGPGFFLRRLFVILLLCSCMNRPYFVFKKTIQWLSDGILYQQRGIALNKDLQLTDDEIENLTLLEIEQYLQGNRRSLKEFGSMPYPKGYVLEQLGNRLIYDERNYDIQALKEEFAELSASLTDEQRRHFKKIMSAVNKQDGGVFFLHGYGGTGKTYIWRTLASALRSKHEIVITVATSGIAALLLPGGRTAHSKFKIPIPTLDNSSCKIPHDSDLAELLRQTKLIIWDEAPMAHKYCFESLDRCLQDLMTKNGEEKKIFGGKVVVFGGDFRQILPVIPRGSRSDIVHASINASYIWDHVEVLTLTKNMRLRQGPNNEGNNEIESFSNWLLAVGEGRISEPNDGIAQIEIPDELLIKNFDDPIKGIVDSTYPSFLQNYNDYQYLLSRAILASTIEVVDSINENMLNIMPGEEQEYLSANDIDRSEIHDYQVTQLFTPEFLSSLRTSGLPSHTIKLKVGAPIMLMRNIDQTQGLCNGTRMIVTKLANHVIEAKIIGGKHHGSVVYIPRLDMSPSQSPWPFKLTRRQFPLMVSYAMTINKSQGQSLDHVGIYLPKDVFSHGQIYVAVSRVKSKQGIKLLIHDDNKVAKEMTNNVVFKEVFNNI
ncbi:uncharacterized protein LOC123886981 [Trifolium pratense]|uniref:uncharacterized protein LOC123886981 n=1 Tax=Trifolium pratense TaxID=57577 RepID=UPI001E693142|nr:uncharacterized protein LOC123886981 [Trifolium pratense]